MIEYPWKPGDWPRPESYLTPNLDPSPFLNLKSDFALPKPHISSFVLFILANTTSALIFPALRELNLL